MEFTLWNGDCLEEMEKIPDGTVDMVMADPPYGTTACKWDSVIPLEPMWKQLKRVIKPNGAIVMTASQPFTSALVMSNPKWFKQDLVWAKNKATGHLNAKRRHMTKHESIVLFCAGQSTYHQQRTTGHKAANYAKRAKQSECYGLADSTEYSGGNTDRCPTTLVEVPVMNNDGSHGMKLHPTQKPVALMEYLIKTYTNEGETVLDFTMGSGTTGVACKNLNRNFIGIELDKDYFEIAKKRIEEA
jgi:DNA modification methylase